MLEVRTILLAEDNRKDVELTVEALSEYRLINQIDVVNDGVEALDYLRCSGKYANRRPGNPVVIILNIKMPRMDGMEVLQEIRNDPNLKSIPEVMLTSSKQDKDIEDSYDLGVNAYVVKPVDFMEFVEVVKKIGGFWAVINESPHEMGYIPAQ